jgi:hypothetical protein
MGFGSVKTAWLMAHKIRFALIEPEQKLGGIVEIDETFVGGKAHNKHADKRDGKPGGTASGKAIVVGAVRRKGNVVARVIENVSAATLDRFVSEAVSNKVSLICTDQWVGYRNLKKTFPHATIDHSSALQKSASSDSVGLSEETIRRCRAVAFANLRWLTHS